MLGHVLSKEQSKDSSNRVSDDGRLTIVQCHLYHRPPSSDLYRSSVGMLPLLWYHQQIYILIIAITNQHHTTLPQHNQSPTMLHTHSMSQANHITHTPVLEVMSLGHHKDLRGFESASFSILRSMSHFVICSIIQPYALLTISLYVYVFLCINTPVCCMYFASLNINLATYFSELAFICLKLLLSLTPDSPTPSGPAKFEAFIKRAVQPISWSQCLAQPQTWYLRPNSKLNNGPEISFHIPL